MDKCLENEMDNLQSHSRSSHYLQLIVDVFFYFTIVINKRETPTLPFAFMSIPSHSI